jgi:hypothetical protein
MAKQKKDAFDKLIVDEKELVRRLNKNELPRPKGQGISAKVKNDGI